MGKKYQYKAYPAYRYFYGKKPILVNNEEEDKKVLSEGWENAPVQDVKEIYARHGLSEDDGEKTAYAVAQLTNLMAQVPGMTRKKHVQALAEQLSIDLTETTLKGMKRELLEKAQGQGELAKLAVEHNKESDPDDHSESDN